MMEVLCGLQKGVIRMPKITERIKELIKIYRPYFKNGQMLPDAPEEAKNAWMEVKVWCDEIDGEQ